MFIGLRNCVLLRCNDIRSKGSPCSQRRVIFRKCRFIRSRLSIRNNSFALFTNITGSILRRGDCVAVGGRTRCRQYLLSSILHWRASVLLRDADYMAPDCIIYVVKFTSSASSHRCMAYCVSAHNLCVASVQTTCGSDGASSKVPSVDGVVLT